MPRSGRKHPIEVNQWMSGPVVSFSQRCLPEVNSDLDVLVVSSLSRLELPWDQPAYQNPEYKRWLDRDYYHNPWKKIDNMILSTKILVDCLERRRRPSLQIFFVAFSFMIQLNVLAWLTFKVTNGCPKYIHKVDEEMEALVTISTSSFTDGTESDHQLLKRMAYVIRETFQHAD